MRMRMKQRLRRATETVRLQTLTRDARWTAASTRAPTEPTADDLPQDASLSPDAVRQVFSLDRCHTCDFIARFCRASARLYRARQSFADAATVELHAATVELHASAPIFPLHDPPSQTQLQNGEIVLYPIFS